MKELSNEELKEVKGGGWSLGIIAGVCAGVAFVIGVIDGYVRPLACH